MAERDNLLDELTKLKAQAQLKSLDTQLTDQQPQGSFGGNALRLFSQGLSFGTADEIEAFARSLFGEKTYASAANLMLCSINVIVLLTLIYL